MNNFEAIKQLPIGSFANMVFHIVRNDCENLEDFENLLKKNFSEEGEGALQRLQHSILN